MREVERDDGYLAIGGQGYGRLSGGHGDVCNRRRKGLTQNVGNGRDPEVEKKLSTYRKPLTKGLRPCERPDEADFADH